MTRLKNIDDKNEEQLKTIKNKAESIEKVTDFVEEPLSPEAIALINEIRSIQKDADYRKLKFTGSNGVMYDFSDYKIFKKLFRDIYYRSMSINETERKQDKFNAALSDLSRYSPRDEKYIVVKNKLLDDANNFYKGRESIIEGFKNGISPFSKKDGMKSDGGDQQSHILDSPEQTKFNDYLEQIKEERKNIEMGLFDKHFPYERPDRMVEVLYTSKSKADNNSVVSLIACCFDHLAKKVKEMPKDVRTEQVKILNIVNKILNFNE